MATTHKIEPNSQGGKNTVLKPLNIVARSNGGNMSQGATTGEVPVLIKRRTRRQVSDAAIKKNMELAEKAQKRADAAKARAERQAALATEKVKQAEQIRLDAERREQEEREAAQRAQEDRERIARDSVSASRGTTTVPAVAMTPEIGTMLKRVTREFEKLFDDLADKYGVQFQFASTDNVSGEPTLVKRGFISVRLRGDLPTEKKSIPVAANDLSVARSEARFMKFYKMIGLTPDLFNKEVRIKDDPHTYIVSGLRGKSHAVVLRRKDNGEMFTVPHGDFKKSLA
jgi:hypothetical protein